MEMPMPTPRPAKTPPLPGSNSPQATGEGKKLANYLCFAIYSANLAFGRAYKSPEQDLLPKTR